MKLFLTTLLSSAVCFSFAQEIETTNKNFFDFSFGNNQMQIENLNYQTASSETNFQSFKRSGKGISFGMVYRRKFTKGLQLFTELQAATAKLEAANGSLLVGKSVNVNLEYKTGILKQVTAFESEKKFSIYLGPQLEIRTNSSENQNDAIAFYNFYGISATMLASYQFNHKHQVELIASTPFIGLLNNAKNLSTFGANSQRDALLGIPEEDEEWCSINKHQGIFASLNYRYQLSKAFQLIANYQFRSYRVNLSETILFESNQLRLGASFSF